MKAFDTNVLLRYIVEDDPRQCAAVRAYVQSHCTLERPGFINRIVLCEFAWVLKRVYGFDRSTIADTLEQILQTGQFSVENQDEASAAIVLCRRHKVDFADALIGVLNEQAGYGKTVTFDKKAAALAEFELLA